ncbi:MAG: phosphoribosylaminoimidazolesuccinocarboxamide synthase [Dehalococcoidia bacterium]
MQAVYETNLSGLIHRGKVRDTYDIGGGLLLMVTSDRISAFDVVMPNPVPGKGAILAQMSAFWFDLTRDVIPNHFVALASDSDAICNVPKTGALAEITPNLLTRAMVVRRAERIDMECVVRAYITGSAWAEYQEHGTMNGAPLPTGLREAERLAEPAFTPSSKAESGHDVPLMRSEAEDLVGVEMREVLEEKSLEVFAVAHAHALKRGMILADTKMEFGFINGELTLIDELLTPDSSRFWAASDWVPGSSPPAFDKQFVRNWLLESGWNREPPAPELPQDITEKTGERYMQAFERLTGRTLSV